MAVHIDPSEVRSGTSSPRPAAVRRQRLRVRAIAIGSFGSAGLIAFAVGAFSFFSTLADPRARPRPMPAAASMPDLKDGMPVLVSGERVGAPAIAATLNLPRPEAAERNPAPAAEPPHVESASIGEPQAPTLRAGPALPSIQNAATLPEPRTITPVTPPSRTAATIAPTRTETVKARAAPVPAVAAPAQPEPVAEPTSTAALAAPASGQPVRKPVAAKSPAQPVVQKTAARKSPSARTIADAAPASVATEASASSDDLEIPGARQLRAGVKALGGLFSGDSKDD